MKISPYTSYLELQSNALLVRQKIYYLQKVGVTELLGRPPLAHRIPSLQIFDQLINLPLKLLLHGQVDVMCLIWLYQLLQHLHVVQLMLLQDNKLSLYTSNITTNGTIQASSIRQ
jgi:hypothetical protein